MAPLERQNANISKVNDFEIVARFSPGPWWGFNGVDDLELSGEVLTRRHYRLFRGKVPVRFAVRSIEFISQSVRLDKRSGQPKWVRMTLRIDGAERTFTGHFPDGKPFADALSAAAVRGDGEH